MLPSSKSLLSAAVNIGIEVTKDTIRHWIDRGRNGLREALKNTRGIEVYVTQEIANTFREECTKYGYPPLTMEAIGDDQQKIILPQGAFHCHESGAIQFYVVGETRVTQNKMPFALRREHVLAITNLERQMLFSPREMSAHSDDTSPQLH
ncbi:hypothetical protein COY07_00295 [Candidatus Peregrinibacteria bacterium CG_4_10_14_0_2_um_filter_43_11]|nr:MAG: hypothetical protein COY07_00295 [Candidatus Peregrinibacteria bacterium CG_4_10_14_0_2_um_filter_43_11]